MWVFVENMIAFVLMFMTENLYRFTEKKRLCNKFSQMINDVHHSIPE
ncbi:hypothetical protein FHS10_003129 [Mucilaginibacter dorajii]|nr:hypothetical protein [Mucilaginibacter dorajii]